MDKKTVRQLISQRRRQLTEQQLGELSLVLYNKVMAP